MCLTRSEIPKSGFIVMQLTLSDISLFCFPIIFTLLHKISSLHNFHRTNDFRDLQIYKTAKFRFKNLCRSKHLKYEKEKRAELINVSQNPREYWKCIKQNCNKMQNSADQVPSESFVTYFKNLLNVEVTTENDDLL